MWFNSRQKQAKQKGNANTEKRISLCPETWPFLLNIALIKNTTTSLDHS